MSRNYRLGDRVIYTRSKYSTCPGPRAINIFAAPNGEAYQYQVEKYWIVTQVLSDGSLVVVTRRGKTHTISGEDQRLRKANWFERLFKSRQFPALAGPTFSRVPTH